VAIKFAGGNVTDAPTLARYMRTTSEFIADQPVLSLATFIRGQTPQAIGLKIQPGRMEAMERMTKDEQRELEHDMRQRYAVTEANIPKAEPRPSLPSPHRPSVTDVDWEDVV
jgi:hypothetical protein